MNALIVMIFINGERWQQTTEGGYHELMVNEKRKIAKFTSDTLKETLYFRCLGPIIKDERGYI